MYLEFNRFNPGKTYIAHGITIGSSIENNHIMLANYLIISIRNILRQKMFSAINIGGLALGLAASWMIALYVGNELSYDRYHTHADRIYRIAQHATWDGGTFDGAITPAPYGPAMKTDFNEVEEFVRIDGEGGGAFVYNAKEYKIGDVLNVDTTFFKVFSASFLLGDKETVLREPQAMVITKTLAEKIFGDVTSALGKTLQAGQDNVVITGVIEDVPVHSHFSFSALRPLQADPDGAWTNAYLYTYILLREPDDVSKLQAKMGAFFNRHMKASMPQMQYEAELQPVTSIHLQSNLDYELGSNGQMAYVYIFGLIAGLILIIASINYMNLSTARASLRIRETGVRKVMGSARTQLIMLFLTESVVITLVASFMAVVLISFSLPFMETFTLQRITIWQFGVWTTAGALFIFSIVAGLLSGVYPALFMSGFKLVPSLKGMAGDHTGNALFRRSLVVFQFVITIVMIAGSLIIHQQMNFVSDKDLGFNKDQVVTFHIENRQMRLQSEAFRNQLLQSALIEDAATAGNPIGNNNIGGRHYAIEVQGVMEDRERVANYFTIDDNFLSTLQIKLIAGRNLSSARASDRTTAVLVNESLVKDAGWDDAIGKKIQTGKTADGTPVIAEVVGVVNDFNIYSLQHQIEPLILKLNQDEYEKDNVYVRLNKADIAAALMFAETVFRKFNPSGVFEYNFLDQNFARQYSVERMQGRLILTFTGLAIFIACLGLFGLITFAAERRRKEMGIRKILGSSVSKIVLILCKDLIILVVIAIFIAIPIAWTSANQWLNNFAYHIEVNWIIFALAGLMAMTVALGTVFLQATHAATENPVKSLRLE